MKSIQKATLFFVTFFLFSFLVSSAHASTHVYVSPTGNDSSGDGSEQSPYETIQYALDQIESGQTVIVQEGTYEEYIRIPDSVSGFEGQPTSLIANGAVTVLGDGSEERIIDVFADYVVIRGFNFDGSVNDMDKIMWVENVEYGVFEYNRFYHGRGECVRVIHNAQNNIFRNNTIEVCGLRDFGGFDGPKKSGGKSGEGFYVGLAPEQVDDSKFKNSANTASQLPCWDGRSSCSNGQRRDRSSYNIFEGNYIDTEANECIDFKEGADYNIARDNICASQRDVNSAAFDSRGPRNTFLHNQVGEPGQRKVFGAAFRTGGDCQSRSSDCDISDSSFYDAADNNVKKNIGYFFAGHDSIMESQSNWDWDRFTFLKLAAEQEVDQFCGNEVDSSMTDFRYANRSAVSHSGQCSDSNNSAGPRICVGWECENVQPTLTQEPSPTATMTPSPTTQPTSIPTSTPTPMPEEVIVTATASSDDGNGAENVLDGDLSTRWSADGDGQWIELAFNENQVVEEVNLAFYKGDQREAFFNIEASVDGTQWTAIATDMVSSGQTNGLQKFDIPEITAGAIRIVGYGNTSNSWNSLTEVTFTFGTGEISPTLTQEPSPTATMTPSPTTQPTSIPTSTPTPMPEEVIVTATASSDDGNGAENVLDGDLSTRWSADGDGQWIEFSFSQEQIIDAINMAFYKGDQRVAYFDIEVSEDGSIWTSLEENLTSSGDTLELQEFVIPGIQTQHIRVVGYGNTSNSWNSMTEVTFTFGIEEITPTPTTQINPTVTPTGEPSPTFTEQPSPTVTTNPTPTPTTGVPSTGDITVTSSSYISPRHHAYTYDGDMNTYWQADGEGEWVQFEFPAEVRIDDLNIAFYSGESIAYTFDIIGSSDGSSWMPLRMDDESESSNDLRNYNVDDEYVNYIRIVGKGNNQDGMIGINEVEFNTF